MFPPKMAAYFMVLLAVLITGATSSTVQTTSQPGSTVPSLIKEEEENSRYKTLEANATLMKLLVDSKDGVSRTEVFDMLHSRDENVDHMDIPIFPEDMENQRTTFPEIPDTQAEMLQGANDFVRKDFRYEDLRQPADEHPALVAAIMIVVTCSVVCIAFASIIIWRRMYLKRHGLKHERLRNEDSFAETRIEL